MNFLKGFTLKLQERRMKLFSKGTATVDLTDPVTTVETMMTPVIRQGTDLIKAVAATGGVTQNGPGGGVGMNLQDVAEQPSVG